jgi:hypothetical protein
MGAGGGEPAVRFGLALVPATENLGRLRELVPVCPPSGRSTATSFAPAMS